MPGSLKYLGIEDKEKNQLARIVVFKSHADSFISKMKMKHAFTCKKFNYDVDSYQKELQRVLDIDEQLKKL